MKCFIDGGYDNIRKRNPYISVKIYDDSKNLVYHANRITVEAVSNNQAEYMALLVCLKWLSLYRDPDYDIEICSDSKLMVEQVNENWVVREPELQKLWEMVSEYKFIYSLIWVPRQIIVKELGH